MAKKKVRKAQSDRIVQLIGAAGQCLRQLHLVGKKLSPRQKGKLKACMLDLVGPSLRKR